ncbi:MarR family transcriptional regulator [Sphingomonas sp. MA1305]|uniref:MarR family winged helix-turn-helix transcriptional regulator n=1 Tax=unclassified Sphingomonas TaxID=196159 RepID=UPI0018E031D1|nr:MarR family transcriptional regulator [Sphingomonas sp. MA1305]MBI0476286.1 MarR family transcriptional regulator [Sphingomonas sp. MA1305]
MAVDPPPAPLPLDEQLCFSLYAATIAINRAYKPMLDRLGITYPQFLVLQAIREQDGRTIGQIAERLSLESSTITPLIKRLEAVGLVSRARDTRDERQVRISLTEAGVQRWRETGCLGPALLQRSGLAPADAIDLNAKIKTLHAALTDPG